MANKSISQLDSASTLQGTDLIEIASDQGSSTYASKSTTLGEVEDHAATTKTYSGLNTTSKTLVGAINGLENIVGNLGENVTSKLTLNTSLTFNSTPSYVAYRVGDIVVLACTCNITNGASAAGSTTKIFTADESIRPAFETVGLSRTSSTLSNSYIDSSGNVGTRAGGTWQQITLIWIIAQS